MGGQSNIFSHPELNDPFGASIPDFKTGIYSKEKRPNINPSQKKAAQAEWEKSISSANQLHK